MPKPRVCTSPKRFKFLEAKSPVKRHNWTEAEDRALVEFVSVSTTDPTYNWSPSSGSNWPAFSAGHRFWTDCAKHIKCSTKSNILLTSKLKS